MKTQVTLQMVLTNEETIGLQAIFVKRADILNGVGIEIDAFGNGKVILTQQF